jgi:lysophospholipase L1-like esterase
MVERGVSVISCLCRSGYHIHTVTLYPKEDRAMRYLALGDSYTIGESVEPEQRWPAQLTARLRERGFAFDDPLIIATTGWTTGDLSRALVQTQPLGRSIWSRC